MKSVEVIELAERAAPLFHPARRRLLEALNEPESAASLARRLDMPRQRVNYHLKELAAQQLIEMVEERKKGSVTERIYRRPSQSYAISGAALGGLGEPEADPRDQFSAAYQIAVAARTIREIGELQRGAAEAGKRLPTLAADAEIRFGSAAARNEFTEELLGLVSGLIAKYHDDNARSGRTFRFHLGAYPKPKGLDGES